MKAHIVSFSIPYPPDYGGAIEVYYKLDALHRLGVDIMLHCFQYGDRQPQTELKKICARVYYYPRRRSPLDALKKIPFIVASRDDKTLLRNLAETPAPILFEGVHTTRWMGHPTLRDVRKVVRLHNVEAEYYASLAQDESSLWKRQFFKTESAKLARYERDALSGADRLLCISQHDFEVYSAQYPDRGRLVPAFHQNTEVNVQPGIGHFALAHADLSIGHNAEMMIEHVRHAFGPGNVEVIVAGRKPPASLKKEIERFSNVSLMENPSDAKMAELQKHAQVHVVYSENYAGFKLRLLASLFTGRHIAVNAELARRSGVSDIVHAFHSYVELIKLLNDLKKEPVTLRDIEHRKEVLLPRFSNEANARKVIQELQLPNQHFAS